jgi:hypothetical protein
MAARETEEARLWNRSVTSDPLLDYEGPACR